MSRSRYAIIRKRLISLRVTPRFKKRRLGFATLICLPDEQKKKYICRMHAGEEIVNRLIWKLLSSSLSGEEELLNRLFSSKWELLPIQLNLKRNNEGIISLVVLSCIDALVELEETSKIDLGRYRSIKVM